MSAFVQWWAHLTFSQAAFWLCVWTLAGFVVAIAFGAFAQTRPDVLPAPDDRAWKRNGVECAGKVRP